MGSAHQHHFKNRVAECPLVRLRNVGDPMRELPSGQLARVKIVHIYFSDVSSVQAENAAKERRLADAIRPEHRKQRTVSNRKADLP